MRSVLEHPEATTLLPPSRVVATRFLKMNAILCNRVAREILPAERRLRFEENWRSQSRGSRRLACGRFLGVGSNDGLRLWAVPNGKLIHQFNKEWYCVYGVAFSPEGRYLATANENGTLSLLRLARKGEVDRLPAGPEK